MAFNLQKYFSLFTLLISNQVLASNVYSKSKVLGVLSDLPSHKDLPVYLSSLGRIIEYCSRNTNYLDSNLVFGLFLVNVNLKPFVDSDAVPISMRNYLNGFIMLSEELRKFYDFKIMKDTPDKIIALLFSNDSAWSTRLKEFHLSLLKKTSSDKSAKAHRKFLEYAKEVNNLQEAMPSPRQSDMCMASLSENEENHTNFSFSCELQPECYKYLIFGTKFGYGLTHRLLLVLIARLSRKCAVFTPSIDEMIRNNFCERAYMEAEYNAANGFKIPDLMFEQMTLCTLDGHAQFLRKSWISSLIRLQDPSGCFFSAMPSNKRFPNIYNRRVDAKCDVHVTSVAASTLAAAVRFILEK